MSNTVNNKKTGMKHGIYKIFWKNGGISLASVGFTHDGANWYAPCNWTSEDNKRPYVASTDWSGIEKVELIIEHNYDPDDDGQPEQPIIEGGTFTKWLIEGNTIFFIDDLKELVRQVNEKKLMWSKFCEILNMKVFERYHSTPSQEAIELAYWKKRAELAESLIVVSLQNRVPTNHFAIKQYWDLWTEHKNSKA